MSKYLITTDTHLGRKNSSPIDLKITKDFFDWTIKIGREKNIEYFLHLGDWHHNRRSISIPALYESYEIFNKLKNNFEESYIILGNHDLYYKNIDIPNSLDIFCFDNINIINKPEMVGNILLIPWIFDESDLNIIKTNTYGAKIIMGHLPINDVILNKAKAKSKDNILNKSDFEDYDIVWSGHYHQYGQYRNIVYIGAPYHMDFNDAGKRGVYIFDDETKEYEFIEYKDAPKYITIDAEDFDDKEIPGNNIRIEFYNNLGLNKINDIIYNIEKLQPNSLDISYKFSNTFTNESNFDSIEEIKANKNILIDYIKESKMPDHLNMKTMENIITSLEK